MRSPDTRPTVLLGIALGVVIATGSWGFSHVLRNPAPTVGESVENPPTTGGVQRVDADVVREASRASIIAVGDVMLSRAVARKIQRHGVGYPFVQTREFLQGGDIVFGNLEHPLTPGREILDNELSLRADPEVAPTLSDAGFDVLSIANNHVPDFGERGVTDTIKYLDETAIKHTGAGATLEEALQPAVLEANGLKFAFLAFNDTDVVPASYGATDKRAGTTLMDIDRMTAAVKTAKEDVDFVIVSMHAGVEYARTPNDRQRKFARAAIDAGADLVIGHHPHVVQPVEQYKGRYILYSLGNFVFDQGWSRETREGMIVTMMFYERGLQDIEFKPVLIEDYAQPRFLGGKEANAVLKWLKLPE